MRTKNLSNENIDFVIIKGGLDQDNAMNILDLLLLCVKNETSGETAILYGAYYGTIESMNVNEDVLKLMPFISKYRNSEQGGAPQGLRATIMQNIETMKKIVDSIISDVQEAFEKTLEKIKKSIEKIVMTILTYLEDLLWLLIRAALLILIYAEFAMMLVLINIVLVSIIAITYALKTFLQTNISIKSTEIKMEGNLSFRFGYKIDKEYNDFIKTEIPLLITYFESPDIAFQINLQFFGFDMDFNEFPEDIFELLYAEKENYVFHSLKTQGFEKYDTIDSKTEELNLELAVEFILGLFDGLAITGGGYSIAVVAAKPKNHIEQLTWEVGTFTVGLLLWWVTTFYLEDDPLKKTFSLLGLGFGFITAGIYCFDSGIAISKKMAELFELIDAITMIYGFKLDIIDIIFGIEGTVYEIEDFFITIIGGISGFIGGMAAVRTKNVDDLFRKISGILSIALGFIWIVAAYLMDNDPP